LKEAFFKVEDAERLAARQAKSLENPRESLENQDARALAEDVKHFISIYDDVL
jgi:cyclopropane fatty-acyl-phospholipid synthase-like methyltransferase